MHRDSVLASSVPTAPGKPCCWPRCPKVIPNGRRFCAEHARAERKRRMVGERERYGPAWREVSKSHRLAHPLCEDCKQRGLTVAAQCVDHVTAISKGGTHDQSNLRSLCASCHARKTALHDGGFGRAPTLAQGRKQSPSRPASNSAPPANTGQRGSPSANVAATGETGGVPPSLGQSPHASYGQRLSLLAGFGIGGSDSEVSHG